eukprot:357023-Chlamydomonas_euryale.AAC.1
MLRPTRSHRKTDASLTGLSRRVELTGLFTESRAELVGRPAWQSRAVSQSSEVARALCRAVLHPPRKCSDTGENPTESLAQSGAELVRRPFRGKRLL